MAFSLLVGPPGLEQSGKSLLSAHLLAETQKLGGIAVLIDTENAVSREFLEAIGVDVSLLSESTYHTFKIHEVRNQPDIEQPMNIDLLCNSLTFTFMLAVAAKYAVTCAPSWVQLFNELKQELS